MTVVGEGNLKKTALITGSTGGIGRAIARKLASKGYNLQLHYNTNTQLALDIQEELIKDYGVEVSLYQFDLINEDSTISLTQALLPKPDIIIHNAGMSLYGLFTDITPEQYHEMIQLHLTSPFWITQQLLPSMLSKKWGRIVFITSIWGETGASCESLYSMTKGGLISLSKSLSKELAPSGITVNAISPGIVDTNMVQHLSHEELTELYQDIPVGRMGSPEEVAHAVHFLLEEGSNYITGQVIRVNGGWYT